MYTLVVITTDRGFRVLGLMDRWAIEEYLKRADFLEGAQAFIYDKNGLLISSKTV